MYVSGRLDDMFPGYTTHKIQANGDCLFAAIAHQLSIGSGRMPLPASAIRKNLNDFIKTNPSAFDDISSAGS